MFCIVVNVVIIVVLVYVVGAWFPETCLGGRP